MTNLRSFGGHPALAAPGSHAFTFDIQALLPGGSWQVSAIYYAIRIVSA